MAIEYKNKITLTKDSTIYGHQSVDDGGFPKNAGNAKVSEILDLAESQTKKNLKGNVSFSVDSTNSRLYHLSLYGESVASFEVPDDKYLKSVSFDETTNKLKFTFVVDEKESVAYVDLSSLIRTYTAGDGLVLSNDKFSLVVKSGEARLKVGADGVYLDLSDITKSIDGKAASDHNHDDRYYTETEMDTKLSGKADSSHTHDDRYYTESEVDTKLGDKADAGHTHDDRYYTESEVDTKLSGKAASSHTHTVSQISDLTSAQISKMNITTMNGKDANFSGTIEAGTIKGNGTFGAMNAHGNTTPLTGRNVYNQSLYTYNIYANGDSANGLPTGYYSVIGFCGHQSNGNGTAEIAIGWTSNRNIYIRSLRDYQDSWYSWVRLWATGDAVTGAVFN